jgi:squalene synthase HpnC
MHATSVIADSPPSSAALPGSEAVLGQAGDENFPVALRGLGGRAARRLMAIYGFARLVDDTGDEVSGDRLQLLDELDREIGRIYAGQPAHHPLMQELAQVVSECELPRDPLERLVQANRQDQSVTRYETFEDLLGYCQLSAAPVGELVLHVFGQATSDRVALSDLVCSGLQVLEHLQDVYEDHRRGRIYLPQADLRRFGCTESQLSRRPASAELRRVVAFEASRTAALLDAGAPLTRELRGRARVAVAGFLAGGRSALRGLEEIDFDVSRPRPGRNRFVFAAAFLTALVGQ